MIEPTVHYSSFEEMMERDGYLVYTNKGYSMMPLLRPGQDLIEIKPLSGRARKYDVVLYKRKQDPGVPYILHRVLKVLPDGHYIIAGDHNCFKEYDITDDKIAGIMTRVVRDGKSIYPTDWKYKVYVHLWCDFYPVRATILYVKRFVRAGLSAVKRRLKKLVGRQ